jgi:hypothetical protein
MTQIRKELYIKLKEINSREATIFPGIVKEVDGNVITVDNGGVEYFNVRLQPTDSVMKGQRLVPKVNSMVLVERVGGDDSNELAVAMFSELDEYSVEIGNVKYKHTGSGFELAKQNESLKKLMKDMLDEVKKLTVQTNTGPSSVPINIAAFTAIETRIDNFFL